jgi:hypothetical protein
MLKDAPQRPCVGKRRGDLVGEIAPRFQAEVLRLLTLNIRRDDLVEQLRPKQAAFDADRWIGRH